MISELFFIIKKNFKLVFRSWTSLLLLIVAPLILILVVGFAFSGEDIHDVNFGYYAADGGNVRSVVDAIGSEQVNLLQYKDIEECKDDLELSIVHLCAEFSPNFGIGFEQAVNGTITFYYDGAKYNLFKSIIDYVNEKIGVSSKEIALNTTKRILQDVDNTVVYLIDTQDKIDEFIDNAKQTRADLVELKASLDAIQQEFKPRYLRIKELQTTVNENAVYLNDSVPLVVDMLGDLEYEIIDLQQDTALLQSVDYSFLNLTNRSLNAELDNFSVSLGEALNLVSGVRDNMSLFHSQSLMLLKEFNMMISQLDDINLFLDDWSFKLERNIELLEKSIFDLREVQDSIDAGISKVSGINQEQANRLLNPIESVFESLLGEQSKVKLIFPILLVFVISFISILLSNMNVLNEVHSDAYFRNFLMPVSSYLFMVGLFITNLLIVAFQIFVLLVVAFFNFGINGFKLDLIASVLLVTSIFVLIGMIFGYMVKSRQTSILLSTFTGLFVFLFSDVIFPLEIMPSLAANLAVLNPLVVGETIFRKMLFYDVGFVFQLPELFSLGLWFIGLVVVLVVVFRKKVKG